MMKGVYIKGMEMPKSCEQCLLFNREFDACNYLNYPVGYEYSNKRMSDCPLIEVPDHGDLVDRDAAPQLVAVLYNDVTGTAVNPTYKIDLSSLPVVIPAERSEYR